MVRSFATRPVAADVLDRVLDAARRAPSAGNTQGWRFVVLCGPEETGRFWDVTLPADRRDGFAWPHLLDAPVLVLPLADPDAYTARYAEPDKAGTGLDVEDAWPVPYWTVDTSFAVMLLLLAAQNEGLGALFFGVFDGETEVRRTLGIPDRLQLLGAVAIGYPLDAARGERPGGSAARPAPSRDAVIRWGGW
jgi:nitroreductase